MRILYVLQNYYPSIGGTQILFQNIAENCHVTYHDECIVYTTDSYIGPDKKWFREIEKKTEVINGITIHRFSFFQFYYWTFSKIIKALKLLHIPVPEIISRYRSGPCSPSLIKAINETDADVILASSCSYLYMLYPLWRNKLKNPKPFVFQGAVHFSDDPTHHALFNKTLQAIKASDYYLANTEYEKERLVGLGVPENIIVVTGIAVDMDLYMNGDKQYYRKLFGLNEEDILIGYIGRIEPTKGIDVLVAAINELKQEGVNLHLVIAGFKSIYSVELENYIAALGGIEKLQIHFLYDIAVSEKVDLYHALDIYVLPSINESFGMVFLEAWSCKKPVIGADIGAIRSVIHNGVDGLLMKPNDFMDLAQKIKFLMNDRDTRLQFGMNGFKKTAENYTWPIVTKKYRDVLLMAKEKFYS